MSIDISGFKEGQRNLWSAGDYPDVAKTIEDAARVLLEAASVHAGAALLDVATGTGNVAIAAAEAGASVTGLDLTPELLEVARRRARQAGLEVRWVEGDAEELPFADDCFDRVTSCFGVIFAPRHRVAADELARVTRPGGRIAVTAWTPEGLNGHFFKAIGAHMPPPPPELESPLLWGREEHMRSLLAHAGAELTFERHTVTFTAQSPQAWVEYHERTLGPLIMARNALEPQGRWQELRAELVGLYSTANESTDGSFCAQAEYLITLAQLPI